ncbi:MAG: hypothetical protein KGJ02_02220 [Verrucomicrobiota bacterium]|nr:hypothetical protein [Verrucomicrobiota bacterium]
MTIKRAAFSNNNLTYPNSFIRRGRFQKLETNVLSEVISYLSAPEMALFINVALHAKKIAQTYLHPAIRSQIKSRTQPSNPLTMREIEQYTRLLHKPPRSSDPLALKLIGRMDNEQVQEILQSLSNIRYLDLKQVRGLSLETLSSLSAVMKTVQEFRIPINRTTEVFGDEEELIINLSSDEEVIQTSWHKAFFEQELQPVLCKLADNSTCLEYLDLSHAYLSDKILIPFLRDTLHTLLLNDEVAEAPSGQYTDQTIDALIAQCPNLSRLELEGQKHISIEALISLLERLPIKQLNIWLGPRASTAFLTALVKYRGEHLTDLNLSIDPYAEPLRHFPPLQDQEEIPLSPPLTDQDIEFLIRRCPSLHRLILNGHSITEAIAPLLGQSAQLKELDLTGTTCIFSSIDSVNALLGHDYEVLRLCVDVSIIKNVLQAIAEKCPNLKELQLYPNGKQWELTDEDLDFVTARCPRLEKFEWINKILSITDESLQKMAERCPRLKWLDLREAPHLTDATIRTLAKKCKHLEELYLRDSKGIRDLRPLRSLPHLQHLQPSIPFRELPHGFCTEEPNLDSPLTVREFLEGLPEDDEGASRSALAGAIPLPVRRTP